MNCDKFVNNISLYIDNELKDIEKREFELHLMKCDNCRIEYESMINIVKILREEEQIELPAEYSASLKEKLVEASSEQKRKVSWKFIASIAATLLVFFTSYELISNNNIFNLSSSEYSSERGHDTSIQQEAYSLDNVKIVANNSELDKDDDAMLGKEHSSELEEVIPQVIAPDANDVAKTDSYKSSSSFTIASENTNQLKDDSRVNGLQASRSMMTTRKTIKEAYIDITVTEFDDRINEIIDYVNANNGFVESMNIDEVKLDTSSQSVVKRQIINIRISQDKFEDVANYIKNIGFLNSSQCTIMDVTDSYNDINNNLTQLHEKDIRLSAILNNLDDENDKMIIEEEILEVKEQIESYNITLHNMQDSTNLSTINATITEGVNESESTSESYDN